MNNKYKIGLALSGGGIRGIAHVGVIKALLENDIVPEAVIGTSAGAIAGCLFAAGKTPDEMMEFVRQWNYLKTVRPGIPIDGLSSLSFLKKHLYNHLQHDSFEKLEKACYVGVTNMNKGELEVLTSGSLTDAVMASSSIPLIFKPVEIEGNIYVDGGVMSNLAVEPLRSECDFLIGVDVMPAGEVSPKSLNNVFGIGTRLFALSIAATAKDNLAKCDVVIAPEVGSYQLFKILTKDFSAIYEAGYECGLQAMDNIKALVG